MSVAVYLNKMVRGWFLILAAESTLKEKSASFKLKKKETAEKYSFRFQHV